MEVRRYVVVSYHGERPEDCHYDHSGDACPTERSFPSYYADGSPDDDCGHSDDDRPCPHHIHEQVEQVGETDYECDDTNHERYRMLRPKEDEDRNNARNEQETVYQTEERACLYQPSHEHCGDTAEQQLKP